MVHTRNIGPTIVFVVAILLELRGYDRRLYIVRAINAKKRLLLQQSTAASYLMLLVLDQRISP